MEAARWFVSGPQPQESNRALAADYAAFGIIQPTQAAPQEFVVDPENREALELFLGLSGDWTIGPSGAMGISKVAVKALFQLQRIPKKRWPVLTDLLQDMQEAALDEIAQIRDKEAKRTR